ncbi:MAG: biotin--[acetyl-CoA-carboxylase] ligase [Pseudomonadota bacterium]
MADGIAQRPALRPADGLASGPVRRLPLSCALTDTRRAHHDSVTSTNTVAWQAIDAGQTALGAPARWVTADQQTAGKGRSGKAWATPVGNVAASLHISRAVPTLAARLALPLVAATATHDAVAMACPELRPGALELKWPNDLLLDGAKLAGILIETRSVPDQDDALHCVIGIGINVASAIAPAVAPGRRVAQLSQSAPAVTPEHVRDCLVVSMDYHLGIWSALTGSVAGQAARAQATPKGGTAHGQRRREGRVQPGAGGEGAQRRHQTTIPPLIRTAYLARALAIGTPISVTAADGAQSGLFAGLADDGALRLRNRHAGERTFAFGEVNVLI